MLLTALPPAPPTPSTVMRGRSSLVSGTFRLIAIFTFSSVTSVCHPRRIAQLIRTYIVESSQEPARQPFPPALGFARAWQSKVWIDHIGGHAGPRHQQTDGRGIVRPGIGRRQAGEGLGPSQPHLLVQDSRRQFAGPGELAGAAGQDRPAPRRNVITAGLEAFLHFAE